MKERMTVALAGQPNSGKSTLFNLLTGARQHVANYPGVTVEKKTGYFSDGNRKHELVDLPGTYSLTSYSLEERVARDFILRSSPDAVLNIVDASNIKRSLYLTLQLLEMEAPLVVVLNMMDVAERRLMSIDVAGLGKHLGVPVLSTVCKKGEGPESIKSALRELDEQKAQTKFRMDYGTLEPFIKRLSDALAGVGDLAKRYPLRWLAAKLLENDSAAIELVREQNVSTLAVLQEACSLREEFEKQEGQSADRHMAFSRHRACAAIARNFISLPGTRKATLSDRADRLICHRVLGPVILLAILFALYQIAIVWGNDLAAMA